MHHHVLYVYMLQIFSVPVYGDDGNVLSERQLQEQFNKVIERSLYRGPPVGVLTADGRNQWGKVYDRMCKGAYMYITVCTLLNHAFQVKLTKVNASIMLCVYILHISCTLHTHMYTVQVQ